MKKRIPTYYISKFTVVFFVICILGGIFTVKGLIRQQHRLHIKNAYNQSEIRLGDFIEFDISREQIMGNYSEDSSKYFPHCVVDVYTSETRYLVATEENKEYYISLIVSREFLPELQRLIDGETKTYHVYGRIEKLKHELHYDSITDCTGIRDMAKLKQLVSTKYELKVIDANKKESIWFKGLIVFLIGILGVLISIEKKT